MGKSGDEGEDGVVEGGEEGVGAGGVGEDAVGRGRVSVAVWVRGNNERDIRTGSGGRL